jgi:hypothetical protein
LVAGALLVHRLLAPHLAALGSTREALKLLYGLLTVDEEWDEK